MPMEAGAIGIRPVNQPQRTGSSDGVQRREDGGSGSGFRPQTNVAIKTAIDDMAGVLSKISTSEKLNMERLPSEVSQVVKNILQQAFSMESTLSQGIGSTLESQRFSMEQLSVFARMLTQIGALAEKGFSMELSDQMELILKNLKSLVVSEEGGNTFEPVLLSKAAFELIDSKNAEQLPQQLYALLSALSEDSSAQTAQPQLNQSDSMAFLKQLVKYFMPRPSTENQVDGQQQTQQPDQRQAAQSQARQFLQSMFGNLKAQQGQQVQQVQGQNQPQNLQRQNPTQQPTGQPNQMLNNQQMPQNQNQPQMMEQQTNQPQQFNQAGQPQQNQQLFDNQQMPQNQSQNQTINQNQTQNQPQQMNQANQSQQPQQTLNNNQQVNQNQAQNQPQQTINNQNQNQPQQMNQVNQNQQQPQQMSNNNQQINQNQAQNQPQQTINNQNQPQQMNQVNQNQNQQQPQQMSNNNQQVNQNQAQNQPQQMNQVNQNQQQPQQVNQNQAQNQPQQMNQSTNQPQQFNQMNQTQQPQQPQQQFNNQQINQNQPQQQFNQAGQPQQAQQSQQVFNDSNLQAQQQLFSQKLQAQLDRLEQGDDFLVKQQQLKNDLQAAKTVLLKQPMQNTPQTMDTMRQLANLIVKNPSLTNLSEREITSLQEFVNNNQTNLSEGEARHLQNLLRLCQQNVPITVQQAAIQQKLPDLTRLWAFMQLCDMAPLTSKLSAKAFKRAGRDVAEFANAMRQSMGGENSSVQNAAQNNRSLQMMMPLYVGDNDTSYPTYLHVYDENEKDKETGEDKKETWLRICVLTDYIGAVELTFRMYENNQLDMRFYFSERSAASEFRTYIPSLKEKLKETTLNVNEVRIGSVGEKMRGED